MVSFKKKIDLIFRLNFGNNIGLGHLIRCIRLSNSLKKKYNIYFAIDNRSNLDKIIIKLPKLNFIYLYEKDKKYKNEKIDAALFLSKTKKINTKVIIVDDYRLSETWHKIIKKKVKKLIVIDDIVNRKIYCDYYINYKYSSNNLLKYKVEKYCNKNSKILLGHNYNLLNKKLKKIKSKKFKLMINFGNSFDFLKIKMLIENISAKLIFKNVEIVICIGIFAKNYEYLFKLKKKFSNIRLLYKKIFIEKKLNSTSLFIGSAGSSVYEMSFLDIPCIFFKTSKNQENSPDDLRDLGFMTYFRSLKFSQKILDLIITIYLNKKEINKLNNKKIFLKKNGLSKIINETKL